VTWLSTIFHDRGTPIETAGYLLALVSIVGIVGAFVTPLVSHKMVDQRVGIVVTVGTTAVGTSGLLFDPHYFDVLWAVLIGWGQRSSNGLANYDDGRSSREPR
jgi:CP family cyanate transporter-like MFS transporter